MTFTREQLTRLARRHYTRLATQGGITPEECVVLAAAELAGAPLDPFVFDDAALLHRAERLVIDGFAASDALTTARAEQASWAERASGARE